MSLYAIAFLDTHVCIYNPYGQCSGIIILCKYYIVILDTVIGSWMFFSYCLLQYYQSFMRIQEETESKKKKFIEEFV